MKKLGPLGSLLLALVVGSAMFALCYWMAARTRVAVAGRSGDDLAWLGREFHLTDADLARLRPLHDGYQPKCEEMCARIATKNRELTAALKRATNVNSEVELKLGEVAALRAECQIQMLHHFQQVARTMPGEQGARYLAEMQRLTLGLHWSFEDLMARP